MRLVIFGASGGTGRLLVSQALARGHEVTAVARNLSALTPRDGLSLHMADVRDPASLEEVATGHDAAISAIGSTTRTPQGTYSASARSIVDALESQGVDRFVCVSSGGVHAKDPGLPLWYRLSIPLFLKDLYRDMAEMERIVRTSALDWTIVRSSYLVDTPERGRFRVENDRNPRRGWRISRADLATFLLDQLDTDRWRHAIPTLAY